MMQVLYVSSDLTDKLKKIKQDNYYILADFDRTLTYSGSLSVWNVSLLNLGEKCTLAAKAVSDKYSKHEFTWRESDATSAKNRFLRDWWQSSLNLLVRYKSSKTIIKNNVCNNSYLKFRDGIREFSDLAHKNNVPFVVASAGITDIIRYSLKKEGILTDNIEIISNELKFDENGFVTGLKNKLIYAINKGERLFGANIKAKIKSRENIFLFGDNIADVLMLNKHNRAKAVKICFFSGSENDIKDYKQQYDVIFSADTSFIEVMNFFF